MRKTEILKLVDDGQERTFRITQMPATKAERWMNKAMFLLISAGKDIKKDSNIDDVIKAIAGVDYDKAEPLYNELIECCTYLPDGNANGAGIGCTQDTIDAQIIDPMNLYKLRLASAKLNFGFFMAALQSLDLEANTITFSKNTRK